jgi:hypothetical protein
MAEQDYTGATVGVLVQNLLGGFGKKPEIPIYKKVDPTAEQGATISGNLANLGGAQRLASQTNQFNLQQLQSMLGTMMPGYAGMQKQIGENIQSQLKGELPPDVQARLQDSAAARSIGGGFAGSGMHGKLVARDFGMTSYQMTQQGLDSANRWMAVNAQTASPFMMDATSMFLSPQQRIAYQFQNTENQFQRDLLANQVKAMPDPFRAALGQAAGAEVGGMQKDVKQFFESYYGGKMGGGGGGGGGMLMGS